MICRCGVSPLQKFRDEVPCAVKVSMASGMTGEEGTQKRELSLIDKVVASVVSNHPFVVRFLACFMASVSKNTEGPTQADVQPPRAYLTVMELVQGIDLSVYVHLSDCCCCCSDYHLFID